MAVAKECSLPLESSSWVDWRVAWFARLDRPLSTGVSVLRSSPVFLCARTGCLAIAGYNPGVPGFPVTKPRLDPFPSAPSICPYLESNPLSFRLRFFFTRPSKPTALTNCFRSQFNANRPWRRIKTSLKGLLQERLNLKHLEKRVGRWKLYSVL